MTCRRTRDRSLASSYRARFSQEAFGQAVQLLVVGHYQVGVTRDDESRHVDVFGAQGVHFGEQDGGVHHDTVTDDRRDGGIEHTRRDELQGERFVMDDDAVTGVVTTLVAHHHVHVTRHEVGQLPLPSSPHWVPTTTVAGTGLLRVGLVAHQA